MSTPSAMSESETMHGVDEENIRSLEPHEVQVICRIIDLLHAAFERKWPIPDPDGHRAPKRVRQKIKKHEALMRREGRE